MSERERNDLKDQLPLKNYSMCPNTTDFMVQGQYWGDAYLELGVYPNEKFDPSYEGWYAVFQTDIARYFKPDDYEKNGYLTVFESDQQTVEFLPVELIEVEKQVMRNENSYFSFKWLDTTVISFFDFSEVFLSYGQNTPQYHYYVDDIEFQEVIFYWE